MRHDDGGRGPRDDVHRLRCRHDAAGGPADGGRVRPDAVGHAHDAHGDVRAAAEPGYGDAR
jgi:hypothetical protein